MSHVMAEQRRRREATVFARYLFQTECPEAVVASYLRFHELYPSRFSPHPDWFDRLLMAMGRRRLLVPVADAYAALFRPQATLRKRLVLCLALLECMPECDQRLQCSSPVSSFRVRIELVLLMLAQGAVLLAAILLLAPVDLVARCGHSMKDSNVS